LVELRYGLRARAAIAFERSQLRALLRTRRVERGLLASDLALDRFESGEFRAQRRDAPRTFVLQVALVGEHAAGIGDAILRQHQLQGRIAADRVGRAQQAGEFLALCAELVTQCDAALLQLGQCRLLALQIGLGPAQRERGGADLLVGLAQLPAGSAALVLDLAPLAGDVLEFALDALELALRLAAALRLRIGNAGARDQREQQQRQQACAHQGPANSDRPVISAGCDRPSSSSMVGATSRKAPPSRNLAECSPT
jgi:hypothetical protein